MSLRCAVCHAEAPIAQDPDAAFCGQCGGPLLGSGAPLRGADSVVVEGEGGSPTPAGPRREETNAADPAPAEAPPPLGAGMGEASQLSQSRLNQAAHHLFSGLPSRAPGSTGSPGLGSVEQAPPSESSSSTMFSLEALMRGPERQAEPEIEAPVVSPPILLDLPGVAPIFGASADEALLTAAVPSKAPPASLRLQSSGRTWAVVFAIVAGAGLLGFAGWAFWPASGFDSRLASFATSGEDSGDLEPASTSVPQGLEDAALALDGQALGKARLSEEAAGAGSLGPSAVSSDASVRRAVAEPASAALVKEAPGARPEAIAAAKALSAPAAQSKSTGKTQAKPTRKTRAKSTRKARAKSTRRTKRRTAPRSRPSPSASRTSESPKSALTRSGFDAQAAKKALGSAAKRSASCRTGALRGRGKVQLTFSSSGRVQTAKLVKGPFQGTTVGRCILAYFRKARVPAFTGKAVTVSKSVTLR